MPLRTGKTMMGFIVITLVFTWMAGIPPRAQASTNDAPQLIANVPIDDPRGIAVNPTNGRAYVTSAADKIYVIDGNNINTYSTDPFPRGVAVNPETGIVYVTHPGLDQVSVFDGSNMQLIRRIPTKLPNGSVEPDRISIDALHGIVYISSQIFTDPAMWIRIYEPTYIWDVGYMNFEFDTSIQDIAINPSTQHLYVRTSMPPGYLYIFNGTNGSIVAQLSGISDNIIVNAKANKVYFSQGDQIVVYDDNNLKELARFNRSYNPMAFNQSNNHLYALGNNQLYILDGDTLEVLSTVPFGSAATIINGIAVDENASKVWLVDIGLSQVHVIQDTVGVPPIVFVHGWYGLYPPCEQADPETYFDLTDDDLIAAGYSVGYAHLESSSCYTPPITENVWGLRKAIALTKAATHQSKVILIAHSMGGLVARAYIEGPDYAGDVSALFTFGSPHQGIPTDLIVFLANGLSLGVYCAKYQPAVCDFSTTGMLLFNQTHKKRADVDYHLISGDAPFSSRSAKGKIAYVLIDGPDDGIVPTSSGTGLAGTLDRGKTDEVHGEIFGTHTYFTRDGGQSVSYTQCLKKVLVDKTSAICGSISTQQTVVQDIPELPEHTPFAYGTLLPGQTTARTISIEGGPTVFATQWQTGTLAVTLVDPNGQVIDPSYALSHSSVVTYTADTTSAIYYLPNAVGGRWQLVLQATSVPTQGSTYTTFAAFSSPVALTDGTDRDQYTAGVTATITATLTGSPSSSEVTATILPTTGVTNTITLSPLGMEQYRGMYTVPNVPGYVEVRLVASGTTATGTSFERGRSLLFKISPTIYLPITRR